MQEYKRKDKTNVFVDRRIGEKDSELSAEDKMIARFAAERINQGKKQGSIFNLGEEETLKLSFLIDFFSLIFLVNLILGCLMILLDIMFIKLGLII